MKCRNRLNAADREVLRAVGQEYYILRGDPKRRLRNALLCLAQSDPGWIVWVEENLPRRGLRERDVVLVEARARARVLKDYNYLGRQEIGSLLFRHDWPFTEEGALSPG